MSSERKGKGKMRDGLRKIADEKKAEQWRKEEQDLLRVFGKEFSNGTLTKEQMRKLGREKYMEYVDAVMKKNFGKKVKWFGDEGIDAGVYIGCSYCIEAKIFDDGYVSCEELRDD